MFTTLMDTGLLLLLFSVIGVLFVSLTEKYNLWVDGILLITGSVGCLIMVYALFGASYGFVPF
jgi:hypothetical protein